jgi:hypoxanthine phosphoribosyltransferase
MIPDQLRYGMLRVLIDEGTVDLKVRELAAAISRDYVDSPALALVGIMDGALPFLSDLLRWMNPSLLERTEYRLVQASSYIGTERGDLSIGEVPDLSEFDVLVVDDILDTGYTLHRITSEVELSNPRSIKTAVFLDKRCRRVYGANAHYVGFEVDDVFVVGYGMDYHDQFRALRWVGALP